VNDFGLRPTQVFFYLIWDWFDGGLRDGWQKLAAKPGACAEE
jgi:hypothetical protein